MRQIFGFTEVEQEKNDVNIFDLCVCKVCNMCDITFLAKKLSKKCI